MGSDGTKTELGTSKGGAVPSTGLLGVSVPFQSVSDLRSVHYAGAPSRAQVYSEYQFRFNPFLIFALSTDTVAESCAWVAMCALSLRLRSGEVWRHRV